MYGTGRSAAAPLLTRRRIATYDRRHSLRTRDVDPAMQQQPTLAEEEAAIIEEFEFFEDAREVIEHIVELGRELPAMDDALKTEASRVRGCQSQVWLTADLDMTSAKMRLTADSDAVIVKGLIALVLRLYDNRPPQVVADSETRVFESIGLGRMLTPGRQNGLYSMLARTRQLAAALAKANNGSIASP